MIRINSPGWTGFLLPFFKRVGIVLRTISEKWSVSFMREVLLIELWGETYVCLIPKRENAVRVKDFGPISLVTSVYKIVAKLLAERMKRVLPNTISSSQGTFVVGRQILDQVLMTNEVIDDYKLHNEEGVIFKIDFKKAYDHVD